jgi:hypothetical protein
MVAVPAATPVITPVELFTVAIAALLVVQAPPVLPFEVKVVLPVPQIVCVPLTVPALGAAVTVMVPVAFTDPQPPVNGIL